MVLWILILSFGICLGIESTLMIQFEQYQGKLCPDVIMFNVSKVGVLKCCVLCNQLDYCHSVFHVPGQVSYCNIVNVTFFLTSGCISDTNAKHYIKSHAPFCHLDDELYRTVRLSDGPFTYKLKENSVNFIQISNGKISNPTYAYAWVVHSSVSGSAAAEDCQTSGGFLAKLSSVPRIEMITELMKTCAGFGQAFYYVGGSNAIAADYLADDAWKWHDGEPINMNSTFWANNRPNRASKDHCMIIEGGMGWKFNDEACNHVLNYICERA